MKIDPSKTHSSAGSQPQKTAIAGPTIGPVDVVAQLMTGNLSVGIEVEDLLRQPASVRVIRNEIADERADSDQQSTHVWNLIGVEKRDWATSENRTETRNVSEGIAVATFELSVWVGSFIDLPL
jgi:hypothetical protein